MASKEERDMRDEVIPHLRLLFPRCRIIHELNVSNGVRRLDIAAVNDSQIIGVEIKSCRDKLDRLDGQIKEYRKVCDFVITLADEKFFEHFDYSDGSKGYRPKQELSDKSSGSSLWHYPRITGETFRHNYYDWNCKRYHSNLTDTKPLLDLLWAEELREIVREYDLAKKGVNQMAMHTSIPLLWESLTGGQVKRAVCAKLMKREFADADKPIV